MKQYLILLVFLFTFLNNYSRSNLENNVAIQGYNSVFYFKIRKATKGNSKYNYTHNGILYLFSSQHNKTKTPLLLLILQTIMNLNMEIGVLMP